MPCKVDYADLESVTKFLDKIAKTNMFTDPIKHSNNIFKAKELSKMIKDKYTKIKPDYEK